MRRSTTAVRVAASLLAILLIAGMAVAAPLANATKRTDPRRDAYVDVWGTSKKRIPVDEGPTLFQFKVHGNLGPDWSVRILVDAHGGRRADYRLWNFESLGEHGCGGLRLSDREPIELRCGRHVLECCSIARLRWRIPWRQLEPDGPIRWSIRTHYPGAVDDADDDRAPDVGWYR